ncbi:hypothetical protein WJX72_012241 [[Myrmecia] bisecta]|uniref:Glycosyl transferase CAP10 domain-containing protein n=1 Tax=[Myrmecia] bisecta TaxID=41462 RepID=A0AAW1PSV9_9CHLO
MKAFAWLSMLHALMAGGDKCYDAAIQTRLPLDDTYKPHKLQDKVPDSEAPYIRWEGTISRKQLDEQCPKHVFEHFNRDLAIARYKIVDNELYVHSTEKGFIDVRRLLFEEMALVMLYLYDMPDMEFLISNMDEPLCGCPVLSYAVDALDASCTAFLMPSERLWLSTMSTAQAHTFTACLKDTYPDDARLIKAVWRGSDTTAGGATLHPHNWLSARRVKLALFGMMFPDTMDVGLVQYTNAAEKTRKMMHILTPIKHRVDVEDFNQYAAIIDVDGNAWSDRFNYLMRFNTVLLKQKPEFYEYFFHWLEPGKHFLFFEGNLSDVVSVVDDALYHWQHDRKRLSTIISNANDFATEKFTHPKVCEALAHTLLAYKKKSAFEFDPDVSDYEKVDRASCCRPFSRAMPEEFLDLLRGAGGPARRTFRRSHLAAQRSP